MTHLLPNGLLNPDMPTQQLLLCAGEMTAQEIRTARAMIRWANAMAMKADTPDLTAAYMAGFERGKDSWQKDKSI